MTPTPHDALFKATFSNPARAMSLVLATFSPQVTRHLDTASATLAPGSFVDEALKERQSDLLFRLRLAGREAFAYLLLEHQSSSDLLMAFRMLRYMTGIWTRWLAEHPDATRLPVILPLVISHAPGGWRGATVLGDLYDLSPEGLRDLAPWMPALRIQVDDLTEQDDATLRGRAADLLTQLVLLALKHVRVTGDIDQLMLGWAELMRALAATRSGVEALALVMRYLYTTSSLTRERALTLIEAGGMGAKVKEAAMTGGEVLIEQGRQEGLRKGRQEGLRKGRQEGLRKGRQEGRQEAARPVFLALLRTRFGEVSAAATRRVESASFEEIERWMQSGDAARSAEELLGL